MNIDDALRIVRDRYTVPTGYATLGNAANALVAEVERLQRDLDRHAKEFFQQSQDLAYVRATAKQLADEMDQHAALKADYLDITKDEVARLRAVRIEWDATGLLWLQIDNGPGKSKAGINLEFEQRSPLEQTALREAAETAGGTQ